VQVFFCVIIESNIGGNMKKQKRMSRAQMSCWIEECVNREFGGNKAEAARAWGVASQQVYDALSSRMLPPAGKILKAVGYKKDRTVYYVESD
jgi:hypothetical protein